MWLQVMWIIQGSPWWNEGFKQHHYIISLEQSCRNINEWVLGFLGSWVLGKDTFWKEDCNILEDITSNEFVLYCTEYKTFFFLMKTNPLNIYIYPVILCTVTGGWSLSEFILEENHEQCGEQAALAAPKGTGSDAIYHTQTLYVYCVFLNYKIFSKRMCLYIFVLHCTIAFMFDISVSECAQVNGWYVTQHKSDPHHICIMSWGYN